MYRMSNEPAIGDHPLAPPTSNRGLAPARSRAGFSRQRAFVSRSCKFPPDDYYENHPAGTRNRHLAVPPIRLMGRNAQKKRFELFPYGCLTRPGTAPAREARGPGAWLDRSPPVRPASSLFS